MDRPRHFGGSGPDGADAPRGPSRARWLRRWAAPVALAAGVAVGGYVIAKTFWGTDGTLSEHPRAADETPREDVRPPGARRAPAVGQPVSAPGPEAPAEEPPPGLTWEVLKEESLKVVRRLTVEFPDSTDPLVMMGKVYDRFQDAEEARKWWRRCLERDPKRADVYVFLAQVAVDKGEHEQASELLAKALEINPRLPGLCNGYAAVLLELGRTQEAIDALEKDLAASPGNGCGLVLLGRAYLQRKEYEKAVETLQRAVELRPGDSEAYFGLGNAYARLGQADKAREHLERYRAMWGEEDAGVIRRMRGASDQRAGTKILAKALVGAGRLYARHGDARKAEACWRRAATYDPKDWEWGEELANLLVATGRVREALEICEGLRAQSPKNASYQLHTGILLAQMQQDEAAEEALRKAIELAPKKADGYRCLAGLFLARNRRLPETRTLAEQLVALDPTAPNYAMLAEACCRSGDMAAARAALARALEIEPGNERLKAAYQALQERR